MKRVIQLILTPEETKFLNNKPVSPCMQCCVGEKECKITCYRYSQYETQISNFDAELIHVAVKVSEIKDIRNRMIELSKQMTTLINDIPSEYYQHIEPLGIEFSPNEEAENEEEEVRDYDECERVD